MSIRFFAFTISVSFTTLAYRYIANISQSFQVSMFVLSNFALLALFVFGSFVFQLFGFLVYRKISTIYKVNYANLPFNFHF